jgi:hypothetical protein
MFWGHVQASQTSLFWHAVVGMLGPKYLAASRQSTQDMSKMNKNGLPFSFWGFGDVKLIGC